MSKYLILNPASVYYKLLSRIPERLNGILSSSMGACQDIQIVKNGIKMFIVVQKNFEIYT